MEISRRKRILERHKMSVSRPERGPESFLTIVITVYVYGYLKLLSPSMTGSFLLQMKLTS